MKALALIFEGFEELEAVAPFALLRRAQIELTIASAASTVTGSHHISLTNIKELKDIDYTSFDCLILPGGAHYKFLKESTFIHKIIKHFIDHKKVIAAICASPTVLGELGYLKGKNYTCFTSMNKDFGGNYIDTGVVVDGNLITARSVAYSIHFAYEIIRKLAGENKLQQVFEQIYYEK